MLGFRYACQTHQKMFVEAVIHEGCSDFEEMEEVRRKLLAWLSQKYPSMVHEQFDKETCLGCIFENAQIDLTPVYDAVRQIVRRLA